MSELCESNTEPKAKRAKTSAASLPRSRSPPVTASLHAWLHPNEPASLVASSPHLHASTSTFISFTISFLPPSYVRSEVSLVKEAKRVVRDLDVVALAGPTLLEESQGAFQGGEGRAPGRGKGKERAREPDHRMWAVRTLGLLEGKDGTGGEGDYQLLEAHDDDGEKFGGERVLRVLRDQRAVDVLTVCCRWFGGDMLGPARFHHIGVTAQHSLADLQALVARRDLRSTIVQLDDEIAALRAAIAPTGSPLQSVNKTEGMDAKPSVPADKYKDIHDLARLERLVKAREKTKTNLEGRVGWTTLDQARAEERTSVTL